MEVMQPMPYYQGVGYHVMSAERCLLCGFTNHVKPYKVSVTPTLVEGVHPVNETVLVNRALIHVTLTSDMQWS